MILENLNDRIVFQYDKVEKYGQNSPKKLVESHKYFNNLIASLDENVYAAGIGITDKEKELFIPHKKNVDGFFGVRGERGAIVSEMKFPVSSLQKNENNCYGNDIENNAFLYPLHGYVSLSIYEMPRYIPNVKGGLIDSFSPIDTFLEKRLARHTEGETPDVGVPIEFYSIFWSDSIDMNSFIGRPIEDYIHYITTLTDIKYCDDLTSLSKGLFIVNDYERLKSEVSYTFKNIREIINNFTLKL